MWRQGRTTTPIAEVIRMEAISASGRFHAAPVTVPDPEPEPRPAPVARAGEITCACCERTPLVGEKAILHETEGRESWACELCERSARKVAGLGEVRDRVRVRPQLTGAEFHYAANAA